MATILYRGEEEARVPAHRVQAYLQDGWDVVKGGTIDTSDDVELEAARELYAEKFGKRPHHKMALTTILDKLDEQDQSSEDQ